jgi:hypothetical protein
MNDDSKKERSDEDFKLYESAFQEFEASGKVSTVRCNQCGGLIEIAKVGISSFQMSCPCGKFNSTLRC